MHWQYIQVAHWHASGTGTLTPHCTGVTASGTGRYYNTRPAGRAQVQLQVELELDEGNAANCLLVLLKRNALTQTVVYPGGIADGGGLRGSTSRNQLEVALWCHTGRSCMQPVPLALPVTVCHLLPVSAVLGTATVTH